MSFVGLTASLQYTLMIVLSPGQTSAEVGHHFNGPTNHFWSCLYESGFTTRLLRTQADFILPEQLLVGMVRLLSFCYARQGYSHGHLRRRIWLIVQQLRYWYFSCKLPIGPIICSKANYPRPSESRGFLLSSTKLHTPPQDCLLRWAGNRGHRQI